MTKRKIMLLAMALCMVAILAVGGTLAYFTAEDSADNVFTMGYVDIELEETFEQKSDLVPGLDINKDFQVLDAHGEPMEGLYAVGSDSAGVLFSEKKPYVTYGGANNGWALTSGYVAGAIVADYVNAAE